MLHPEQRSSWSPHAIFRCPICETKISREQSRRFQSCKDIGCRNEVRRRMRKLDKQQENEWRERMQGRSESALKVVQQQQADASEDQLVIIPVSLVAAHPQTNVAEKRKRRFREHLMRQITAAATRSPLDASKDPFEAEPDPIKSTACATCRGACCEQGGDEAYLTSETLRKFMNANPELRPRDVLDAYLDRIPNKAYLDSCIFHTQTGCTLSREMRSSVCNRHECAALMKLSERELPKDQPIYVVSMDDSGTAIRNAKIDPQ